MILGRLISGKGLGQTAEGEGCKSQPPFKELTGHLSLLYSDYLSTLLSSPKDNKILRAGIMSLIFVSPASHTEPGTL